MPGGLNFGMLHRLTQNDRFGIAIRRTGIWTAMILWSMAGFAVASMADAPQKAGQSWQITADRITFDQENQDYVAEGNVRITRENRVLTADMVRLNQETREAWANGHVRLLSNGDILTGQRMQLNLKNETGTLYDGSVFFQQNHFYISGETISKTGPDTYHAEHAAVTSCDGPNPDWRITSSDLKVTIEGYGFAKNAALWARKIPVIYTPYIAFPVKLKRQTGLLTPEFGISDRKGEEYLQPFFWAINESSDATFFADYMSKRGVRMGAEYRYIASERSFGTLMADGFKDRKVDNGQDDVSAQYGYTDDAILAPQPGPLLGKSQSQPGSALADDGQAGCGLCQRPGLPERVS